jgi:hypothetical protein
MSDGAEKSLLVAAVDLKPYGVIAGDDSLTSIPRGLVTLCESSSLVSGPAPLTMLSGNGYGFVVCQVEESLVAISPYLSHHIDGVESEAFQVSDVDDPYFTSLIHPVICCAGALGLNSEGFIASPGDDSLHVFSELQLRRQSSGIFNHTLKTLGAIDPVIRHWLCRTSPGDFAETGRSANPIKAPFAIGGEEVATGGAETSIICELTCADESSNSLTPQRIVRATSYVSVCAVLFAPAIVHSSGGARNAYPVAYALIKASEPQDSSFQLHHGRDLVFFPSTDETKDSIRAMVLENDGTSLREVSITFSSAGVPTYIEGSAVDIFQAVQKFSKVSNVATVKRIFLLRGQNKLRTVFLATRLADGRSCLFLGPHSSVGSVERLIPRTDDFPTFWLDDEEEILSLIELPTYEDGARPCIAIATQCRVGIMTSSLCLLAEYRTKIPSSSLASLGSHSVAFCSSSSAAGGGDAKIRYLNCVGSFRHTQGVIATIPSTRFGCAPHLLLAIRPDRIVHLSCHRGIRLVENGRNENTFLSPTATTRPAFLLEPLVANALCQGGGSVSDARKNKNIQQLLRTVLERFGRKTSSFPHSEGEGTGILGRFSSTHVCAKYSYHSDRATFSKFLLILLPSSCSLTSGTGITKTVYELLEMFRCDQAASFLLTGNPAHENSHKGKTLPPWVQTSIKAKVAGNTVQTLRALAAGDEHLTEYVSSPDNALPSNLPRSNDSSALLSRQLAEIALNAGNTRDALKLMDFSGGNVLEEALLQLSLSQHLVASSDFDKILSAISRSSNAPSSSIFAAIKKTSSKVDEASLENLAPSVQKGHDEMRPRRKLLGEASVLSMMTNKKKKVDAEYPWDNRLDDTKSVWRKGPFNKKEEILLLESIEEWLGRKRPTILGKRGAEAAAESGEKTLADILSAAEQGIDQEFDLENAQAVASTTGWAQGVGEGREDEDNLSLYLRFSEGSNDAVDWRTGGTEDLSKHAMQAFVSGADALTLEVSTSTVDDGEEGKVKPLYDLVWCEDSGAAKACGLFIEIKRGGCLDVGMFHSKENSSRNRCTIEFWYHLPETSKTVGEIVLARRSLASEEGDLAKLCLKTETAKMMWELVLVPSGHLQLRTSGGGVLDSSGSAAGLVSLQRDDGLGGWNHVCITFSGNIQERIGDCLVSIMMKGLTVASGKLSLLPPGLEEADLTDDENLNVVMARSVLLFGLGVPSGFRLAEVRAWSCERKEDDVSFMMTEYLRAAETKKKFKVKIRTKQGSARKGGGFLSPPNERADTARRLLSPGILSPPPRGTAWSEDVDNKDDVVAQDEATLDAFDAFGGSSGFPTSFGSNFDQHMIAGEGKSKALARDLVAGPATPKEQADTMKGRAQLNQNLRVVYAPPLSNEVRSSAAAALVRGPPATRHFGGNRGGLMNYHHDYSSKRCGVGSIAICGAEKTVIYYHDKNPSGKTYPIGASGAIVSDVLDSGKCEYLCCFLAKEKRMVVFELASKTVVVELQMAAKLNFWRFLPPEVHGNTLVYMLVTPVGGFHWMPLEESPRPRQVWKRRPDLQGKKIVSYEEGGCNGGVGRAMRSTIALLLTSTETSGAPVEAWCLSVDAGSHTLLLNDGVLGAALCVPPMLAGLGGGEVSKFFPHVVIARRGGKADTINVEVVSIGMDPSSGLLKKFDSIASTVFNEAFTSVVTVEPPMAMGSVPEINCCCLGCHVVICVRKTGFVAILELSEENGLALIGQKSLGQYIVDVGIRPGEKEGDAEIVLFLCDESSTKDGHIMRMFVEN